MDHILAGIDIRYVNGKATDQVARAVCGAREELHASTTMRVWPFIADKFHFDRPVCVPCWSKFSDLIEKIRAVL